MTARLTLPISQAGGYGRPAAMSVASSHGAGSTGLAGRTSQFSQGYGSAMSTSPNIRGYAMTGASPLPGQSPAGLDSIFLTPMSQAPAGTPNNMGGHSVRSERRVGTVHFDNSGAVDMGGGSVPLVRSAGRAHTHHHVQMEVAPDMSSSQTVQNYSRERARTSVTFVDADPLSQSVDTPLAANSPTHGIARPAFRRRATSDLSEMIAQPRHRGTSNSSDATNVAAAAPPTRSNRRHQTMAMPGSAPMEPAPRNRRRAMTQAIPDAFGAIQEVDPTDAEYSGSLPTFMGQPYQPGARSVLVIGPGGGTRMNGPAYQALTQSGWDISVAMDPSYDRSPAYPDFLYPPGWEQGQPDLSMNGGKNLVTFADQVLVPMIKQLIAAGRGPAAIMCGSRGGHCPLPRLWSTGAWNGPVICINGGCVKFPVPASPCRLLLITGGQDYFETKNPQATKQMLQKADPSQPVLVYHDPKEGHMPGSMGDVFGPLLEIVVSEESFLATAQAARQGTYLLPQPQARRHNCPLMAF